MTDEQIKSMQRAWLESSNQLAAALRLIADIRAAAGDPEGKMMQDEFIEHVKELNHLAYKVKAETGLRKNFEELCRAQEHRINALNLENTMLKSAIEKTLVENGHLADGEDCTLIDLKRVMRGDFSPWTRIDYGRPPRNETVIVSWAGDSSRKPELRSWYSVNGCREWDDSDMPTHWMKLPEYRV